MNQPLEIYVAAGHYASGVKATVQMWYYSPYGRREEVYDITEINSDSVKILTVPAYMRNVGKLTEWLLILQTSVILFYYLTLVKETDRFVYNYKSHLMGHQCRALALPEPLQSLQSGETKS